MDHKKILINGVLIWVAIMLIAIATAAFGQDVKTAPPAKPAPAKRTTPAKKPVETAKPQKPASEPQEEILTNDSVIELVKLGLPEDLVIAKIGSTKCIFNLTVAEMGRLKTEGVTAKIMAVMMAKTNPVLANPTSAPAPNPAPTAVTTAPVTSAPNPDQPQTAAYDENDPNAPHESGIYIYTVVDGQKKMIILERAGYQGSKTGSVLASQVTFGIKKAKIKAVLPGAKASIRTSEHVPVFYFYFEGKGGGLGKANQNWFGAQDIQSPNQFSLIKLKINPRSRETIVGEVGSLGASSGTHEKSLVTFKMERIKSGIYKVTPVEGLETGAEYCFLASSTAMGAAAGQNAPMGSPAGYATVGGTDLHIYDFGVSSGE